ncbi:MAG: methionine--tRNA ligase subunit beta [Desulfurococcales archaeon]|nr:methionine--tRNA ligase subunit beta [Desulfurococcales archaeon]MEB3799362.1 methionine--tRNA ligase subunit beta [Desulfurococcales archaeon]MEB3846014.1 methionine--tRNA ligase subunit beta [Desulfurococcales archaeon]
MDETIDYTDFSKIDLRVGKVVEAEPVPNSRKLIRLIVDLGDEKRQILAGLAKWYKPEDFMGKYVIVVANLKPKRMAGLVSQGMLLAAGCTDDTKPVLLTVSEEVKPGEKIC